MAHYHIERNHWGLANRLLQPGPITGPSHPVQRRQRLGGMLNYYPGPHYARGGVAIKAALRATAEVLAWGKKATELAHDRLEAARLLELIGQWVSFIGTFCTAASAAVGSSRLVLPLAVVALVGQVCVASMHYYRGDLLGGRSKLITAYTTLIRSVPELGYIVAQLEEWKGTGSPELSDKRAVALANRAHMLVGKIHRAIKAVPGWRRILKPAQQPNE